MKKPKKGWHYNRCGKCKKVYTLTTHFGGNKELPDCEYCQDGHCYECWNYIESLESICKEIVASIKWSGDINQCNLAPKLSRLSSVLNMKKEFPKVDSKNKEK